jgi:hypothetical protein
MGFIPDPKYFHKHEKVELIKDFYYRYEYGTYEKGTVFTVLKSEAWGPNPFRKYCRAYLNTHTDAIYIPYSILKRVSE